MRGASAFRLILTLVLLGLIRPAGAEVVRQLTRTEFAQPYDRFVQVGDDIWVRIDPKSLKMLEEIRGRFASSQWTMQIKNAEPESYPIDRLAGVPMYENIATGEVVRCRNEKELCYWMLYQTQGVLYLEGTIDQLIRNGAKVAVTQSSFSHACLQSAGAASERSRRSDSESQRQMVVTVGALLKPNLVPGQRFSGYVMWDGRSSSKAIKLRSVPVNGQITAATQARRFSSADELLKALDAKGVRKYSHFFPRVAVTQRPRFADASGRLGDVATITEIGGGRLTQRGEIEVSWERVVVQMRDQ